MIKLCFRIYMPVILFLCNYVQAQQVSIGQPIKDVNIPQIINYKTSSSNLYSFKGKPLLLVFWNTTCSDALELLPKLDSIRKAYNNKLEILIVTYQTAWEINKTIKAKPFLSVVSLPIVIEDTLIRKHFPHRSQPHIVWVNGKGVVNAITGHNQVTEINLQQFIKNNLPDLPLKSGSMDNNVFFSLTPLMINEYEKTKHILKFYSYIGGRREGILSGSSGPSFNAEEGVMRGHVRNGSFYRLYKFAYRKNHGFHDKRIITPANNSFDEITAEHYCYDLILKDTSRSKAISFMQQDLDRFFGLNSSIEKRKIKVLVLKRTSSVDKLKWDENGTKQNYFDKGWFYAYGLKFHNIIDWFNGDSKFHLPLVDETGYTGRISLVMNADFKNLSAVRKSLIKYDLDLIEEEREMEVLVLKQQ